MASPHPPFSYRGAGFIGANFVLHWLAQADTRVVNLDKLTTGNLANLASVRDDARHVFVQGDIGDAGLVSRLLAEHRPRAIVNFAARATSTFHPQRGRVHRDECLGTFRLLETVRNYWQSLPGVTKRLPLSARVDRRSLWFAGPADRFHGAP